MGAPNIIATVSWVHLPVTNASPPIKMLTPPPSAESGYMPDFKLGLWATLSIPYTWWYRFKFYDTKSQTQNQCPRPTHTTRLWLCMVYVCTSGNSVTFDIQNISILLNNVSIQLYLRVTPLRTMEPRFPVQTACVQICVHKVSDLKFSPALPKTCSTIQSCVTETVHAVQISLQHLYCTLQYTSYYPCRLCRLAWVGRLRPSVCLSKRLSAA